MYQSFVKRLSTTLKTVKKRKDTFSDTLRFSVFRRMNKLNKYLCQSKHRKCSWINYTNYRRWSNEAPAQHKERSVMISRRLSNDSMTIYLGEEATRFVTGRWWLTFEIQFPALWSHSSSTGSHCSNSRNHCWKSESLSGKMPDWSLSPDNVLSFRVPNYLVYSSVKQQREENIRSYSRTVMIFGKINWYYK